MGVSWGIVEEIAGRRSVTYIFGAFRLDTDRYELSEDGEAVHVEPLVFDLLALFVANAGAVIDRDRMIETVWGGRIVSEATLSTAVKSARRALGDSGEAQTFIETVRGRGFRFRAPVTVADAGRRASRRRPRAGSAGRGARRTRRARRRSPSCPSCASATREAACRGSRRRCPTR